MVSGGGTGVGGRKAEAEKIRDQAVAVFDDARLKSAVTDAEARVRKNLHQ